MPAATASMPTRHPAEGGKMRLLTLGDLDRRTRAFQSANSLHAELVSDMGGEMHVSAGQRELAMRAAVLTALLEDMEARLLLGEGISFADYLPATNALNRLLKTIGLERRQRNVTPDLSSYLASKAANG